LRAGSAVLARSAETAAAQAFERAEALLDLYDTWSSVIWSYASTHTSSSAEAHRVVVDAFGIAVQNTSFFDGPASPLTRLLTIIVDRLEREPAPALLAPIN
jgi:hypothetical protein